MGVFRKICEALLVTLLVIWQFPQILLGFLIFILSNSNVISHTCENNLPCNYFRNPFGNWGFSLGYFIFVPDDFDQNAYRHEEGHTKQSQMLGPLYLLVVGVSSSILFIYRRSKNKSFEWYHSKFPEKWADRLGGAYGYNKDFNK